MKNNICTLYEALKSIEDYCLRVRKIIFKQHLIAEKREILCRTNNINN